ncbi:Imm52 family immunity protein, partial [Burkholderia multivorans]|nr:Imm52 family immunity protein [Burkholderia multivorans]
GLGFLQKPDDLLFRKALLHVRLLLRKRTLLDSGWPCLQGAGQLELSAQQIPEAQETIPVLSADGKKRLGTILVSIKDEVFSADNEEHLVAAHNIEARLVSMDLLPLVSEI